MRLSVLMLFTSVFLWSGSAAGATCDPEDFTLRVSGASQCLLMRRFGPEDPSTLVVWLHGDVGSGGPANYHFAHADKAANEFADQGVLSVALVRPGYPDGSGDSSSVAFFHSGRRDHYTKENVGQVAAAIARLKSKFNARKVIAVGHSGGAATIAVILGLRPGLLDGAVLVACPCDLARWRQGRRPWAASEDPMTWSSRVNTQARVIALTGQADGNTHPHLAQAYVAALSARGVLATFQSLPDATHNGAFRAPEVFVAVKELLDAW